MSIQYGSLYVDEKYKASILPNLFYKTWIMPGITCQDATSDNNGSWFWHKLTSSGAPAVKLPGQDFTDEAAADTLVQCTYNNNFQRSKKIYGVQAASVAFPVAEEHLALATNEVSEGKNLSGLACLIQEGTASSDTAALTAANFVEKVIAERKAIVKAKGTANVVLCSPDAFACMLEAAGSKYLPTTNEKIIAAAAGGQVGEYLGMLWIEVNGFANSTAIEYYDYTSTKRTITAANLALVDFIMYDAAALGIGDNFNIARIVDSELFAGSKAQVEDNVAFRVLQNTVVRVKKHAA